MKRLSKPSIDPGEVYRNCVNVVPDSASKARLLAATDEVIQLAEGYDACAAEKKLYLLSACTWGKDEQVIVGAASKGDLTNLYTNHMSKRNQAARSYYDHLMLTPLGKCPYCGFGHVSTLDHFLPKSRYPSFSVLPINLVPSCFDCNRGKASGVIDSNNQIPHPYYEEVNIETDTWLYAAVERTAPASVSFFVDMPTEWSDTLAKRVENFFRDFGLATRFAVEAASEMVSLADYLAQLEADELIEKHLRQIAALERKRRRNTWQAALYDALAESGWYRQIGWRLK